MIFFLPESCDTLIEFLSPLWTYILPFLALISVLVFVHEWGHYAVARKNSVRVEVFSIGFGKELFGRTDRHGTRWKICAIPLGGYVKMFGDQGVISNPDGEMLREMTAAEKAESFHYKTVGQRAAIVFAGPAINYLFAVLVLGILFAIAGQAHTPAIIGTVAADSAAAKAGLKTGDRILRINGSTVARLEDVRQVAAIRPGQAMPIVIDRNGATQTLTVTPDRTTFKDKHGNQNVVGTLGVQQYVAPVIGRVVPNSAAARAGLTSGDKILSVDGIKIATFNELRTIIVRSPGKTLPVTIQRGQTRMVVSVTPVSAKATLKDGSVRSIGRLGVGAAAPPRKQYGVITAFWQAVKETIVLTKTMGVAIGQIIVGDRTVRDLSGPLRIAEASGDMARIGLYAFFWFLGVLSLNLCLVNLLPIPMLDGGHLLFYGIEAVRRKPLSARAQEYGFRIGLALVLTLMIFATWNDLVYLRVIDFFKNLVM